MDNTAVTVYIYPGFPLKANDYIMRVKRDDSAGKFEVAFFEKTSEFGMKILNPLLENFVLRKAFKNLWQAYKYNQEYISFLLKTSTKEQFLEKAKEFAQTFEEIDENQLYYGANLLLNILDQPLTSADISLFFNIDPNLLDTNTHPLLEYDPESTDTK